MVGARCALLREWDMHESGEAAAMDTIRFALDGLVFELDLCADCRAAGSAAGRRRAGRLTYGPGDGSDGRG